MLVCSCGWQGVNLVPNYEDNTAKCPKCPTIFKGIPAKDAVVVSPTEEEKITIQAAVDLAVIKIAAQMVTSKPKE